MIFTATLLSLAYSDRPVIKDLSPKEQPWTSVAAVDYQFLHCLRGSVYAQNYNQWCKNMAKPAGARMHRVENEAYLENAIADTIANNREEFFTSHYFEAGANTLERCAYHFLDVANKLFHCIATSDLLTKDHGPETMTQSTFDKKLKEFRKIVKEVKSDALKAYDPLGQDVINEYRGSHASGNSPWGLSTTGSAALRAFQGIHRQADQMKQIMTLKWQAFGYSPFSQKSGCDDKQSDDSLEEESKKHEDADAIHTKTTENRAGFKIALADEIAAPVKTNGVDNVSFTKGSGVAPDPST